VHILIHATHPPDTSQVSGCQEAARIDELGRVISNPVSHVGERPCYRQASLLRHTLGLTIPRPSVVQGRIECLARSLRVILGVK
jgi:hypothetical protein